MLRKNKDNKIVTQKVLEKTLEKTLEKALTSQSKVILDAVSDKFKKIDQKFEKVSERFDNVDQKFEKVSERFDNVDQKFEKVDKQIKEKFDKILDGQDGICKQLTDLQDENKASTELYKCHDKKIKNHEKRINKLELNIQSVKHA